MAIKIIVKWRTKDEDAIRHIRKYFNLPTYTTVNGCTPGTLNDSEKEMFEECVRRGFFTYIESDWTYNGATYSW